MNLLILVTQLERAGAQKVAFMLARQAHTLGHQVTLAFLYDKEGWLAEAQAREPFPIVDFGCRHVGGSKLGDVGRTARGVWRLWRQMRRERVNVLFTMTPFSNWLGSTAGLMAGVPVRVASQRNSLPDYSPLLLKFDGAVANSRLVSAMTAPSQKTVDFCIDTQGIRTEKLHLILNGVQLPDTHIKPIEALQLREMLGIEPEQKVVLTIGRYHPQKGHRYLIEAATQLNRSDVVFLCVGDGALRDQLAQQIESVGMTDGIRLLGVRDDVPQLLAISDLFVLPSLYEGMSNALLEAMAARVPVLVTDVDGTRELVTHKETGFVVPAGDASALANALKTMLDDPQKGERMAEAGYEHVARHFSAETTLNQHLDLFQTLLDKHG